MALSVSLARSDHEVNKKGYVTLCDAYLNVNLPFAICHKGKAWPLKLCFKEQNRGLAGFLRKNSENARKFGRNYHPRWNDKRTQE